MSSLRLVSKLPDKPIGELVSLSETNHLFARRASVGDQLEVLDSNTGSIYSAELKDLSKSHAEILIKELISKAQTSPIKLIVGLSKPKTSDFIVEKAIELGVGKIHFFSADRTQNTKPNDSRIERFERIAESALKQSGFQVAPRIKIHSSLKDCLEELTCPHEATKLVFHTDGEGEANLKASLLSQKLENNQQISTSPAAPQNIQQRTNNAESLLVIGPEGGLSPEELLVAKSEGFLPASFGPKTLRVETAVILACGLFSIFREA